MKWTTHSELKKKLMTRWDSGSLLSEGIAPNNLFPMRLVLKGPTPSELGDQFAAAQDWVQGIVAGFKNTAWVIEWSEINHRQLGRNQLPRALIIPSLEGLARWLGKSTDLQQFINLSNTLLNAFPTLQAWAIKYPHVLLKEKANLPRLMAILQWINTNPKPGIYLRQLSLSGIDTKFIEQHKKLLSEWLDLHLTAEHIVHDSRGINQFTARYGFKDKPAQVRFRILDEAFYIHGIADLMITVEAFTQLNLPIDTVYITENDINGLAFPDVPQAIVLFGRGYGLEFLKNANWLQEKKIQYWGDLDTHGFAILNQCRQYLPQTQSFLMDESTLLAHQAHWSKEQKPTHAVLTHLTEEESRLYQALQNNTFGENVRLEQEFIGFDKVLNKIQG